MSKHADPHKHQSPMHSFHPADPKAGWCILDKNGHVVDQHNAHVRQDPASTTKMATLYTIAHLIETQQLPSDFIQQHARDIDRMCIRSDNDSAMRLAEAAGGSVSHFCDMMNRLMKSKGLTESHFTCPSGWPQEGHYSTAADMARVPFLLKRDYPQYTRLMGKDSLTPDEVKRGGAAQNTAHDIIHEYCDFGKTGTGHGVYGSKNAKSFIGGCDHGFFSVIGLEAHGDCVTFSAYAAALLHDHEVRYVKEKPQHETAVERAKREAKAHVHTAHLPVHHAQDSHRPSSAGVPHGKHKAERISHHPR